MYTVCSLWNPFVAELDTPYLLNDFLWFAGMVWYIVWAHKIVLQLLVLFSLESKLHDSSACFHRKCNI